MTKLLIFFCGTAIANLRLLIISTLLTVNKALAGVYEPQVSFFVSNSQFQLWKDKKNIPSTIYILVSASQKISFKNQNLSQLY